MITCCKCGADCGPGNGVSMCLGCNELADMEVQDRSYILSERIPVSIILSQTISIDVSGSMRQFNPNI